MLEKDDRTISQLELPGGTDHHALIALARAFPATNLHIVDLPYRLSSWALDDPANAGLWFDAEGRLSAWAVMQTPFWTIDYVCHPEAEAYLHRQILIWTDRRARQLLDTPGGRPCWFVMVFSDQAERIRDLEGLGFVSQANAGENAWSKVLMQRAGQIPVAGCALPAGFTVRPLTGGQEVNAYVQLHRAVFESKNMTAEWRQRTLRHPEYRSDLDLVVEAPDGSLAAFCVCWLGQEPGGRLSGQVEPLGVHPSYRKLGIGRAILSEGLRRLYRNGADRAFVETDNYRNAAFELYQALGFHVIRDVLVFRKDYN